jgi:hypothetical protein
VSVKGEVLPAAREDTTRHKTSRPTRHFQLRTSTSCCAALALADAAARAFALF